MTEPLMRIFDSLELGDSARNSLLESGVSKDALLLRTITEDPGPSTGNFLVGNAHVGGGGVEGFADVPGDDRDAYSRNFERTAQTGNHLLLVQPADAADRHRLVDLLQRLGGRDPDEKLSQAGP